MGYKRIKKNLHKKDPNNKLPDFKKGDWVAAISKREIVNKLQAEEIYFNILNDLQDALLEGRSIPLPYIGELMVKRMPSKNAHVNFPEPAIIKKPAYRRLVFQPTLEFKRQIKPVIDDDPFDEL